MYLKLFLYRIFKPLRTKAIIRMIARNEKKPLLEKLLVEEYHKEIINVKNGSFSTKTNYLIEACLSLNYPIIENLIALNTPLKVKDYNAFHIFINNMESSKEIALHTFDGFLNNYKKYELNLNKNIQKLEEITNFYISSFGPERVYETYKLKGFDFSKSITICQILYSYGIEDELKKNFFLLYNIFKSSKTNYAFGVKPLPLDWKDFDLKKFFSHESFPLALQKTFGTTNKKIIKEISKKVLVFSESKNIYFKIECLLALFRFKTLFLNNFKNVDLFSYLLEKTSQEPILISKMEIEVISEIFTNKQAVNFFINCEKTSRNNFSRISEFYSQKKLLRDACYKMYRHPSILERIKKIDFSEKNDPYKLSDIVSKLSRKEEFEDFDLKIFFHRPFLKDLEGLEIMGYKIAFPKTNHDLINLGIELKNCAGSTPFYSTDARRGMNFFICLKNKKKTEYLIEIRHDALSQFEGKARCKPPSLLMAKVNDFLIEHKLIKTYSKNNSII